MAASARVKHILDLVAELSDDEADALYAALDAEDFGWFEPDDEEPLEEWMVTELDAREKNDHGGTPWEAVAARVREHLVRRRTA